MQTFNITRGQKIAAECKNHSLEWPKIVDALTTHKVGSNKKDHGYFVGGMFANNYRNAENMVSRSMVTIDVDSFDGTGEDVISELEHNLPYTLLAYSTFSSRFDKPKFRIVIPLLSEIPAQDYEPLCKALADEFKEFTFDPCAFKPELAMYMPSSSKEGIMDSFSYSKTVEFLDVNDFDIEKYRDFVDSSDGDASGLGISDDLEDYLKYQPLGISDDEIQEHLLVYKAENISPYEEWLDVGRALHHQYEGNEQGYHLWYNWSELDSARFDANEMVSKWVSFTKRIASGKTPLTFATVKMRANEVRKVELSGLFDEVIAPIESEFIEGEVIGSNVNNKNKVVDIESYDELRKRLSKVSLSVVPESKRSMMAQTIHNEWGKTAGLTKAEIKRELMPKKKVIAIDSNLPEWAQDWIYIKTKARYYNLTANYEIVKEAFNQEYSGEIECKDAEVTASQFMSVVYKMKSVVDCMYWPNADTFFTHQGKDMLNSYKACGITPASDLVNDLDGQGVVDKFLAHTKMTFANIREETIMLDWMSHIYQHPGERVNWAILLQGAQGSGKSYFGKVMELILGSNAQKVKPDAIMGRFSAWATGSILNIVEEIYVTGSNKYDLMNKIKDYIRNEVIQIEEKGRDQRNVPNFASYLFFSNHRDALVITEEERAYCIIYGAIQSPEQLNKLLGGINGVNDYFETLFAETNRRPDAIAHYLMNREISADFKPYGRAPLTAARSSMINYSANSEVEHIQDLIEHFRCDIINENIIDLTYLTSLIKLETFCDVVQLPSAKMTQHILIDMQYHKLDSRVNVKNSGNKVTKHTIWYKIQDTLFDEKNISKFVQEFHKKFEV